MRLPNLSFFVLLAVSVLFLLNECNAKNTGDALLINSGSHIKKQVDVNDAYETTSNSKNPDISAAIITKADGTEGAGESDSTGGSTGGSTGSSEGDNKDGDDGLPATTNPFIMSVSMIIVSEIGDKTFLIAALMAMKAPRLAVFTAAFASLAIMTVLSGIVGHTLPTLIPQKFTQLAAAGLFVVFGIKLFREGLSMSKDVGVDEEMAEVEEEIAMNDINTRLDMQESAQHDGDNVSSQDSKPELPVYVKFGKEVKNLFAFMLSPLWVQVFVMTFLGEWGDRSQIATIAMAAGSNYWLVIMGAIVGHGLCTGGAVLGGKLLATRISMRNVTLGGAIAFFVFAGLYFYDSTKSS